jgi:hypothetical protein
MPEPRGSVRSEAQTSGLQDRQQRLGPPHSHRYSAGQGASVLYFFFDFHKRRLIDIDKVFSMGFKNIEFYADIKFVEMVVKNSPKKLYSNNVGKGIKTKKLKIGKQICLQPLLEHFL